MLRRSPEVGYSGFPRCERVFLPIAKTSDESPILLKISPDVCRADADTGSTPGSHRTSQQAASTHAVCRPTTDPRRKT